jgi:hypothetical protein
MKEEMSKSKHGRAIAISLRVLIAATVFLAVCVIIDLIRQQPIQMLTGERAGGVVAISLVILIDSFRTRKTEK